MINRFDRIRELRRKVEVLSSEARSLKCEFDDDGKAQTALESAEDCLDDAALRLTVAAADY